MALAAGDRAIVRRWAGTVATEGELDEKIERLGSAYAVALEVLQDRLSDMALQPTTKRAGGRSSDHKANLAPVQERIDQLVAYVGDEANGISLPGPAQDLFDEASGGSASGTSVFVIETPNPRRG